MSLYPTLRYRPGMRPMRHNPDRKLLLIESPTKALPYRFDTDEECEALEREVRAAGGRVLSRFLDCFVCGEDVHDAYWVYDPLWREAGLHPRCGYVHLACFAEQLGRPVTEADFDFNRPINEVLRIGIALGKNGAFPA